MDLNVKNTPATTLIISVILTALIVGGSVYAWITSQSTKTQNDLRTQIMDLQAEVNTKASETPIPATTFKSSSTTDYSFEYPSSALLVDASTFTYNGVNYSIETPSAAGHTTIETWIKDVNASSSSTDLSKYSKTTVSGKTAYTFTGMLGTYVMNANKVYVLIARKGIAPFTDTTDPTYAHLLSSFKFK